MTRARPTSSWAVAGESWLKEMQQILRRVSMLLWAIDGGLLGIMAMAVWRFISLTEDIENLIVAFSLTDQLVAFGAILVLFEMTRRVFGIALSMVAALSMVYCLWGAYLPWFLRHSGFSFEQTMEIIWYGYQGVFGTMSGSITANVAGTGALTIPMIKKRGFSFMFFQVVLKRKTAVDRNFEKYLGFLSHLKGKKSEDIKMLNVSDFGILVFFAYSQ